jgi:hypothetical protein
MDIATAVLRVTTIEKVTRPITKTTAFMMYSGNSKEYASVFSSFELAVKMAEDDLLRGRTDLIMTVDC